MDPTYARYGKDLSVRFDQLDDIDNQNWPLFHVHDFGHNLKNAEASLERVMAHHECAGNIMSTMGIS